MTHKTKGIVLRSIKYGDTSLVVTIFTELFGVQTYIVNGVRSSKKNAAKANQLQPSSILELVVYHNQNKQMQRIKEFSWAVLFNHLLTDVIKNSIAIFMAELLQKSLKQPEHNPDLFNFCESCFCRLDESDKTASANFALYFSLQLAQNLGFKITDNYSEQNTILDLEEGIFHKCQPAHTNFVEGRFAELTSMLLKVKQPQELNNIKLNHETRRSLLKRYLDFYALHMQDFGQMKTLTVLNEVL